MCREGDSPCHLKERIRQVLFHLDSGEVLGKVIDALAGKSPAAPIVPVWSHSLERLTPYRHINRAVFNHPGLARNAILHLGAGKYAAMTRCIASDPLP